MPDNDGCLSFFWDERMAGLILAHLQWSLAAIGLASAYVGVLCTYLFFHRKKAELNTLIKAAPLGIGLISNRVFIHINDRVCQMTGYSKAELVGHNSRLLYPTQEDYDYVGQEKYRQIRQRGVGMVETRWRRKDGQIIDVLLSSSPIDARNLKRGVIFTALDITEQKKTERALQFTQFATDHAGEAMFWVTPDARFMYVNDAACRNLGYSRQELLKMSVFDIDPVFPPSQWPQHWSQIRQQSVVTLESCHKAKNGHVFPVLITTNFLVYEGREYDCAIVRDISERKTAEEAQQRLMQQLQLKNEELQSILFIASHDLRSPLVNIRGFAGELEKSFAQLEALLAAEHLGETARSQLDAMLKTDIPESLGLITAGSRKMENLLTGLLQLNRIGTTQLCPITLDMNRMFKRIVENFRYRMRQIDIAIDIDESLPACRGDAVLINQVFTNLIDNAIKYRRPGRAAHIHVSARTEDKAVVYCVADNGVGIGQEYLDKVFEVFYRLNPDSEKDGEGLGLTIVRRILDRQDGRVWLKSTPDIGTSVYVQLPRA